jgi:hypothetical protein
MLAQTKYRKSQLLEMLLAVERAILAYNISGLPGLRVAVERTIGVAVLHNQRFEQSPQVD